MGNSTTSFLTLYGVLSGLLIVMIAMLIFLSDKIFKESKNEDIKEGANSFIMKITSLIITLYLFAF
jgi:hypothetical protein